MDVRTKVTLLGKEISLFVGIGVIEDAQAWADANNIKDGKQQMKQSRVMLALMEHYANGDIPDDGDTDKLNEIAKESSKYKALGTDEFARVMRIIEGIGADAEKKT
jgi:hypothetical protein